MTPRPHLLLRTLIDHTHFARFADGSGPSPDGLLLRDALLEAWH